MDLVFDKSGTVRLRFLLYDS